MALQKSLVGCAVWKLHISRYNFYSLGNINCSFNSNLNWKFTEDLFFFFFCLLHKPNCSRHSLEGSVFHCHLWMRLKHSFPPLNQLHIWFGRREKPFRIIKSHTLDFSTVWTWASHNFSSLYFLNSKEDGLTWSPRSLLLQNHMINFSGNVLGSSRFNMIWVFH